MLLSSTRKLILRMRFQYYNDVHFTAKLAEHKMPFESYALRVLEDPELTKAYRQQFRLWMKALKIEKKILLHKIAVLEAENANKERLY